MTSPLPLLTERLRLRNYRLDDVEPLLAFYSRPDVARYLLEEPWDLARARDQVATRTERRGIDAAGVGLAVVVELGSEVIGCLKLSPTDDSMSMGEVGWVFHPSHSGHGYATEAVRALIAIAFEHYGMHRIKATLDVRNTASALLCERVGMTREAHLREEWFYKGEWSDTVVYGLLRNDPRPPPPHSPPPH